MKLLKSCKQILVVTYLERHLQKMIPIIHEIEKRKEYNLKVILRTSFEAKLAEKEGIKYVKFDHYEKRRGADFDIEWGLYPLIKAIEEEKPDLLLAIEVNLILRNAIRLCKNIGTKTLIVQHGTPNKYSLHAFAPFEADYFAAWGNFTRDFLVSNGVDSDRIVVTGGPIFDTYLSVKHDKERIYQELGIRSDIKKLIVFTMQGQGAGFRPSLEEIETGVIETIKAASQYPEIELVFQIHPQQKIEDVEIIAKKAWPLKAKIIRYGDTESLIAVADGVITFFSTTAIDALIFNKPLLLINLTDDKDFFPFVPMQAAYGAYTKEEIENAFRQLVENPDILKPARQNAVEYMAYKIDGKSMDRVMALVEKMLGEKKWNQRK